MKQSQISPSPKNERKELKKKQVKANDKNNEQARSMLEFFSKMGLHKGARAVRNTRKLYGYRWHVTLHIKEK
jgi:hypothetical protein